MQIKNLGQENGFWFQLNLETDPPILIISNPETQKQEYIFGKLGKNQKFHFAMNRLFPGVTIEIDKYNSVFWFKNNKLHRKDGPAVVQADGSKSWFKDGLRHREDGPAVIHTDGTEFWYKNGKLHREDGPAVIYPDGTKSWYKNDRRHREDGPAIVFADGKKFWYKDGDLYQKEYFKNGKLHRTCYKQ